MCRASHEPGGPRRCSSDARNSYVTAAQSVDELEARVTGLLAAAPRSARNGDQPALRRFRLDATGLQGRRMRLMDALPTSDAGWPQEALVGHTDVVCIDDTPDVMHNLQVHPVGEPGMVGLVEFTQLALYDGQT